MGSYSVSYGQSRKTPIYPPYGELFFLVHEINVNITVCPLYRGVIPNQPMEMWAQVLGCPLQGELFHSYRNFDYNRSVCPLHGELFCTTYGTWASGYGLSPVRRSYSEQHPEKSSSASLSPAWEVILRLLIKLILN